MVGEKPLLESYTDCNGRRCYRARGEGERIRHEKRLKLLAAARRHEAMVRQENAERRLTNIDPDWREHFGGDWERATDFYFKPHQGRVVHSSPFEPPTVIDNRETDFDDDPSPQ